MCCWFVRVYWTVLQNLFARLYNNLIEQNFCYQRMRCCRCCVGYQRQANSAKSTNSKDSKPIDDVDKQQVSDFAEDDENSRRSAAFGYQQQQQHDYVIVDDADAHYVEIEQRTIEMEPYYFTVDRTTAERMLSDREDGACLVRPFKDTDLCIKYIVSIYAAQQYYHLFVRKIEGRQLYGIGQEKQHEQHFRTPSDIVEFYAQHSLLCTNKQRSQCVTLKPITCA